MKTPRPRRRPYTELGIRRVPCFRCGAPSRFQWQICADGNVWRGLCPACDIALNAMVLVFVRDPEIHQKMAAYRKRVGVVPVVQVRNPRTDRYVKVDRGRGTIVGHKATPGPYKGVPVARRRR